MDQFNTTTLTPNRERGQYLKLKTVQYLAGHENSKVTMDIYAKVKYNKPWELAKVVNAAFPDPDKNMESEL